MRLSSSVVMRAAAIAVALTACGAPNPAFLADEAFPDAGAQDGGGVTGGARRPAADAGSAGASGQSGAAGAGGGGAGTSGAGGAAGTLAADLVARWDMEEGSGDVLGDAASNPASEGQLEMGVRWKAEGHPRAQGPSAWSLEFDDATGYVDITWREALQLDGAKSISLWFRAYGGQDCTCIETYLALVDPTGDVGLQIGTDRGRLAVWKWGGELIAYTDEPATETWHHVVHTYDGTTHTLYLDGQAAATGTYAVPRADITSARLGTHHENDEYFGGLIDDVRIWSRALSAVDVAALWNGS